MAQQTIDAPLPCRSVLFDATELVQHPRPGPYIVPATIQRVLQRDLVLLVAYDDRGELLRAVGGGLPSANYGEHSPGVPSVGCWCYQPRSSKTIEVETGPRLDLDQLLEPVPDDSHHAAADEFDEVTTVAHARMLPDEVHETVQVRLGYQVDLDEHVAGGAGDRYSFRARGRAAVLWYSPAVSRGQWVRFASELCQDAAVVVADPVGLLLRALRAPRVAAATPRSYELAVQALRAELGPVYGVRPDGLQNYPGLDDLAMQIAAVDAAANDGDGDGGDGVAVPGSLMGASSTEQRNLARRGGGSVG